MTDDELAMAYADGELDAVSAKRFEKRMAESAELSEAVRAHRALRERLTQGFAAVADAPLPERLTELLQSKVVTMRPKAWFARPWSAGAAMAACLVAGLAIGQYWRVPPTGVSGERLMASASLSRSLDQELAGGRESPRILVSFRDRRGSYCRVFEASELGGIACRESDGWSLLRTQAKAGTGRGEYRQAGSGDADLLAAAQEMMSGDPLDAAAERSARTKGWR